MQREKTGKRGGFSASELKWILYDVGNSAFVLLASTILPIYFGDSPTRRASARRSPPPIGAIRRQR